MATPKNTLVYFQTNSKVPKSNDEVRRNIMQGETKEEVYRMLGKHKKTPV